MNQTATSHLRISLVQLFVIIRSTNSALLKKIHRMQYMLSGSCYFIHNVSCEWQILVLPPYQHKGYGRYLLEVLNDISISVDVYHLTVEEPLDYFQLVHTSDA